ncbi:MAG: hypothetical protein R3A52_27425 [Polyangiales bacterium]
MSDCSSDTARSARAAASSSTPDSTILAAAAARASADPGARRERASTARCATSSHGAEQPCTASARPVGLTSSARR